MISKYSFSKPIKFETIKKASLFLLKLGFSFLILYIVLQQISIAEYKNAFSLISPTTVFFVVFIVILQIFILAYRWCYLTFLTSKLTLPLYDAVIGMLISFFFSQGLPASIGGDAFRICWLFRRGVDTSSAIKIIFFDRVYGLIALTIFCIGSVFILFQILGLSKEIISFAIATTIMAIVLGFIIMPIRLGITQYIVKTTTHFPSFVVRMVAWGKQTRESLSQQGFSQSFTLIATSLLTHFMVIVQAYMIGHILDPEKITFLICVLAVPPALFVSYLPFSIAGWGVREASLVIAFGFFGITSATAIIISLAIGMAVLLTSLLGWIFWVVCEDRKHKHLATLTHSEGTL